MNAVDYFFYILAELDSFFWSYIGFVIICLSGLYLTFKSKGEQFRVLFNIRKTINMLLADAAKSKEGLHPFKLFFASVGGMIGVGNIVMVGIAVMLGGPGTIFWMWVASFCGMLIKYSEIYLGVKHRVSDGKGSFNGGPMYYLQDVFKSNFWAILSAILLCIYGVEVFQFTTLVDRFETTFSLNRDLIVYCLLAATLYSASGGINRLANVCVVMMPFFLIAYLIACSYIILVNADLLPALIIHIFKSAFTGQAAVGGFAASTMLHAAYLGTSKAVYSGDIGIGYDSVVQSETRVLCPINQARLSIIALFMDTVICTFSSLTIAITGAWHRMQDCEPSEVMARIFGEYFPFSEYFLTTVLFFAGFTTVIAFFVVGTKAAMFLSPKYGKITYLIYGATSFVFFAHFTEEKVAIMMNVTSVFLVILNIVAIIKMRKEIKFK